MCKLKPVLWSFLALALWLCVSVLGAARAEDVLTEAEVRRFLAQGDAAVNAGRFEQTVQMLAPDVAIQVTLNGETTRLNRQQYAQLLSQGKSLLQSYRYRSQIHAIQISGNRAVVKATAYETANLGEQGSYTATTQEVSTVEKRNGQLYITSVASQPQVQR